MFCIFLHFFHSVLVKNSAISSSQIAVNAVFVSSGGIKQLVYHAWK